MLVCWQRPGHWTDWWDPGTEDVRAPSSSKPPVTTLGHCRRVPEHIQLSSHSLTSPLLLAFPAGITGGSGGGKCFLIQWVLFHCIGNMRGQLTNPLGGQRWEIYHQLEAGASGLDSHVMWPESTPSNKFQQKQKDTSALAGATIMRNVILPLPRDIHYVHFATTKLLTTSRGKDKASRPKSTKRGGGSRRFSLLVSRRWDVPPIGWGKWLLLFSLLWCGRAAFIPCMHL